VLDKISLENILFLDIETVPAYAGYDQMPDLFKKLWDTKAERIRTPEPNLTPQELYPRAGIYSEFGKIVCISYGFFKNEPDGLKLNIKSIFGTDEKKILLDFINLIVTQFNPNKNFLCAHNGKEFDFPYLSRRILLNNLKLPAVFDIAGKKPWEVEYFLDTMNLWRFGDIKSYTSLDLLCAIFNIPSSKDDIEGKDVWKVYWQEQDLKRIVTYCEKDVVAIARLVMRFKGMEIIKDENVAKSNP
jgi:3'-5' exonuclease